MTQTICDNIVPFMFSYPKQFMRKQIQTNRQTRSQTPHNHIRNSIQLDMEFQNQYFKTTFLFNLYNPQSQLYEPTNASHVSTLSNFLQKKKNVSREILSMVTCCQHMQCHGQDMAISIIVTVHNNETILICQICLLTHGVTFSSVSPYYRSDMLFHIKKIHMAQRHKIDHQ